MKKSLKDFGPWAIVTGASSGIGKEFARQLAEAGLNLILFARREKMLQEVANEFAQKYNIQTKAVKIDLTQEGFLEKIDAETKDLEVGLLVSNAGAAHMGTFNKLSAVDLENMLQLNVMVQMKISHYFSNRLIERKKAGGLLLVSSSVAFQGAPYMANYSGAKAYILNLGEALNVELDEKGISVSVLLPGPTDAPGLTDRTDADMTAHLPMKPQPVEACVKEGLQALQKNKPYQIAGGKNRMMSAMGKRMMSRKASSKMWGKMLRKMVKVK